MQLGEPTVSLAEWERRKEFVGFSEEDVRLLTALRPMAHTQLDGIVEELFRRFFQFDELRAFFTDDAMIRRVKQAHKQYFLELTLGDYGEQYLAKRLGIGWLHKQVGLEPRWYLGAYSIYTELMFPRVLDAFDPNFALARRTFIALLKIMMLDQDLAMTTYTSTAIQHRSE